MDKEELLRKIFNIRSEGTKHLLHRYAKTNGKFLTNEEFKQVRMEVHKMDGSYLSLYKQIKKMK